ncbi:hypothetical protein [Arthrobacter sp. CAN_C5]|uniref:hypothetical protein n=1 Tax=Arthrobacter sp. CAN_C5 TaxID=2760706 RepID=UPI001AE1F5EB|nr:hypothetical protein [Arthrobacter sp. CAN_C5]MBP2218082.1 D-aminopeptidase [Arthrobacter sp. CAN_C5]
MLGPISTLRHRLIAAQTINALCHGLPGIPNVQAAGDSWLVRGMTGTVIQCATVNDVWLAILQDPAALPHRDRLLQRLQARARSETGLALNVATSGLRIGSSLVPEDA